MLMKVIYMSKMIYTKVLSLLPHKFGSWPKKRLPLILVHTVMQTIYNLYILNPPISIFGTSTTEIFFPPDKNENFNNLVPPCIITSIEVDGCNRGHVRRQQIIRSNTICPQKHSDQETN